VKKIRMLSVGLLVIFPAFAIAGALQMGVLDGYLSAAKAENASFSGFSAERGKELFMSKNDVSPEIPSCTTCHTIDPTLAGQSRAGKEIEPMAISKTPNRFMDAEKVEKWFTRNCQSVLGRTCTAQEKGDFITFMSSL